MAFATIDVTKGITGTIPVANGGTGLASGTTGEFLKFTGSTAIGTGEAGGGITEVDQYRITSTFTGSANPITSNWERNDTVFDKIGAGMTQSSGNFQFPNTGIYKVEFNLPFSRNGNNQYSAIKINVTTDNSNYTLRATSYGFIEEAGAETYSSVYAQTIVDVTDTSNVKVQFGVVNQAVCNFYGDTNANQAVATFIRLGDT